MEVPLLISHVTAIEQSNFHWLSSSSSKAIIKVNGLKPPSLKMNTQLLSSDECKLLVKQRMHSWKELPLFILTYIYDIQTELFIIKEPENGLCLAKKELNL